jgi:hypothetical protein
MKKENCEEMNKENPQMGFLKIAQIYMSKEFDQ